LTKTLTALLLATLAVSSAQAGDLDRFLKGVLKEKMGLPTEEKVAMAPRPPAKPAEGATTGGTASPADQLMQAVLSGKTSSAEERRIGDQIAGNFLGAAKLVPDDALQNYVNLVGNWVAAQSERADLAWRFGVVDSEDINAFAAPGGYIFVTKGLYRQLSDEAELAAVLGHEIGHVVKKHHLKVMQKSKVIAAGAMLLGKKFKDENEVIRNLVGNGAEIMSRSLDKDAEYEADRIGMVLAARAGYDVYALPKVLEDLGHISDKDSRVALLYKTHPHPNDRFEHLAEAAADRFDKLPEGKTLGHRFYRLP
jgi:predicted Zn-dependent protease